MNGAPIRAFHFSLITGPASHNRLLKNLALLLAGAAIAAGYSAFLRRRQKRQGRGAPGDVVVGAQVLETRAAVDRLLQSYLGQPQDVVPRALVNVCPNIIESLQLPVRLAILCERHCTAVRDFTGERGEATALELGCGIGATSFELTRGFPRVFGLDTSKAFINAAKTLKERGWMRYTAMEEGDLDTERTAVVASDIERDRVQFGVVDDMNALPQQLTGPYDAVLVSSLLCRLPRPKMFLDQFKNLVAPDGVLVICSQYDWREDITPRAGWIGGFKDKDGTEIWTADALKESLHHHFSLAHQEDLLLLVRENRRRFQLCVQHVTVWQRNLNLNDFFK